MKIVDSSKESLRSAPEKSSLNWPGAGTQRVAAIGECMIEITEREGVGLSYGYAGDTLNTAVYLAREFNDCGHKVDYVTAVGDDDFSQQMVKLWIDEGVGTELVTVIPGELPGLYWVRTDNSGERSFFYWRKETAAQKLMEATRAFGLAEQLAHYNIIYLSGITLAILLKESRELLLAMLDQLRRSGVLIVFDTNYRPKPWGSKQEAAFWITRLAEIAHVATVSFDDEQAVFGDGSTKDTIARLHATGVEEVIVKNGAKPCMVSDTQTLIEVPLKTIVKQVDTTAAGDSFNAGYINARISGKGLQESVECAQKIAAMVVQFPGAVIPK